MKFTLREHLSIFSSLCFTFCYIIEYWVMSFIFLYFVFFWQLREAGSFKQLFKYYKMGLESMKK